MHVIKEPVRHLSFSSIAVYGLSVGIGNQTQNLMGWESNTVTTTCYANPSPMVSPAGYLNVLVNSQWRSRWCLIRDGQLWFYSDKGKGKVSRPAVALGGCSVVPLPSPEHLYTFRIDLDGTQLATLEVGTPWAPRCSTVC